MYITRNTTFAVLLLVYACVACVVYYHRSSTKNYIDSNNSPN